MFHLGPMQQFDPVLPAHSAVMIRQGFYLFEGKAVREKLALHSYAEATGQEMLLMLLIPGPLSLCDFLYFLY